MNESHKKLKQQYKLTKPDMGIFKIASAVSSKAYLQATQDLRGTMNGALVRLRGGMHPWRELQKEWSEQGEGNFTIEILEHLPYDKDEAKTDYSEELKILELIWEEKLQKDGIVLYQKRLPQS